MSRVFRESLERELPLYRRIGCPSLAQFSSCVGPWQRDYSFLFYVLSILCPFSLSRISILVFFFVCVCVVLFDSRSLKMKGAITSSHLWHFRRKVSALLFFFFYPIVSSVYSRNGQMIPKRNRLLLLLFFFLLLNVFILS